MPGAVTKVALRQALEGMLPDAIRLRPKKAFAATDFELGDARVWRSLEAHLAPEAVRRFGLFDPGMVEALVRDNRRTGAHRNDFVSPFAFVASVQILAEYITSARVNRHDMSNTLELTREYRDEHGIIV
jgi:asparagine synthetase B (glutamine-hydrolysing)